MTKHWGPAIFIAVLTILSLPGSAQEVPLHPVDSSNLSMVGREAAELGIAEYRIQHGHDDKVGTLSAELVRPGGIVAGRVIIDWREDGSTALEVHYEDTVVSVDWDISRGILTLTDWQTLRSAQKTLTADGWSGADEERSFWEEKSAAAKLGAIVLGDYLRNSGHGKPTPTARNNQRSRSMESPGAGETEELYPGDGAPRCTGPTVRGDAVGSSRSLCCDDARNEANIKCWNDWCVGCCRHLACDAACAVGDYFCVCGLTGRACGPSC